MSKTKTLKEIVIRRKLYPRENVDQDKVKEYSELIGVLPPITINQDNVIVDGFHRYYGYKLADEVVIETETIQTDGDDDLLLKAIELNAKHGLPLDDKRKKRYVTTFYQKILNKDNGVNGINLTYDTQRLKKTFSIPDSTFSDWTKNLNEEIEAQRLEKIMDLHLQCKTQEEIANEILGSKEKHNQISTKLKEIKENMDELSKNSDSEIPTKYGEIAKKWQEVSKTVDLFLKTKEDGDEDTYLNLYNVWNAPKIENEYKHHGNFPIEFMENLLYYYTEPFDVVYDPFAGGGVAIDACKKWFRKYYASDIKPIELRDDIKKWKIQDGIPKDLPKPDFVFLDPPYWKQASGKYSDDPDDLANMPLDKYYNILETFLKEIKKKIKNDSYVAFIISATQKDGRREEHAFEIYRMFRQLKFRLIDRIICPYSTQQYNGTQVDNAKETKTMMNLHRDLMIFQKDNGSSQPQTMIDSLI